MIVITNFADKKRSLFWIKLILLLFIGQGFQNGLAGAESPWSGAYYPWFGIINHLFSDRKA
jgi:hypothetical protein